MMGMTATIMMSCLPIWIWDRYHAASHGLTEIGQLCEIESIPDCLLKGIPGTAKPAIQITTGVSPNHRDTQTGYELGQRTVPAFLNRSLKAVKGFYSEALGSDNFIPVLFQLIQITEVPNPAVTNEFLKGRIR